MAKARTITIITLAGALVLASCGSDSTGQAGDATAVAVDVAATAAEEPAADTTERSGDGSSDDAEQLPDVALAAADEGPSTVVASSAMGGVSFEAAEVRNVSVGNDFVGVRVDEPGDAVKPEANVALVTQSVTQATIMTVADYLDAVATDPTAVVEPTGDALDLLGYRLTGYTISNGGTEEDPMLFSVTRAGAEVTSVAAPFPYATVYLAETPAGVLQASIEGLDAEHAEQAAGAFSLLVESIEFTGPGLDAPLPPGEVIESTTPGPPPEPAAEVEGGPPALEAVFSPVDPGTYQLLNTGLPATIDVPEGWFVQPNFPGIIAFSAPDSQGPGDRDLVITRNVVEYVPTGAGPNVIGEIETISDIDGFIENPPVGLSISGVGEVELGTLTGTQFDVTIDPSSDCSDSSPCEVLLLTPFGVGAAFQVNNDHRVWWVEAPDGPLVMVAMALGDQEFIERATDLALALQVS